MLHGVPGRMSLTPDMSHYTEALPDGLQRLRLTSPSGLTVNAWLVRAPAGWLLVDTGFTYTTDALVEQLVQAGLSLDDIDAALYTHTHEDHMGGGVVLDEHLRRRHVIAAGTEPALVNYFDWYDNLESWVGWMERVLPASPIRDVIIQFRRGRSIPNWRTGGTGLLTDPHWVQPGERVQLSGFTWSCIPVPGHDPWHVAWYLQAPVALRRRCSAGLTDSAGAAAPGPAGSVRRFAAATGRAPTASRSGLARPRTCIHSAGTGRS